jgi:DNA (cytosine-5)-methyltransferase 1
VNVGSLFSGIGGMDYGLARAGLRHVFFCESDPWRRQVLAARWPGVPVYDDVATLGSVADTEPGWDDHGAMGSARRGERALLSVGHEIPAVDLLCGGFPCQDVSVAGQRRGLAGERSGLFYEFARIIDTLRPRWVLIENVPGLLSSNGGRDFGAVLGTLADVGYGLGWRILDSRFFGVPQRRRRVFIVGAVVDGDPAAAARRAGQVLAVGSRCPGHPPTGTETRPDVAGTLGGGAGERGWAQDVERMTFLPIAAPLTKGSATGEGVNPPGRRQEDDVNIVATGFHMLQDPISEEELAPAWGKGNKNGAASIGVSSMAGVRRLTPTECERLQGLPDGWTDLGGSPDSRRYSGLGDAVTATVAEWIGRRLVAA